MSVPAALVVGLGIGVQIGMALIIGVTRLFMGERKKAILSFLTGIMFLITFCIIILMEIRGG
jgi:hypothetical protein